MPHQEKRLFGPGPEDLLRRAGEDAKADLEGLPSFRDPRNALTNLVDYLSTGQYAVQNLLLGKPEFAARSLAAGALGAPTMGLFDPMGVREKLLPDEARASFSDVLGELGMEPGLGRGALGFVGDVALDPTTYLTFGAGAGPKVAEKLGPLGFKLAARKGLGKIAAEEGLRFGKGGVEELARRNALEAPGLVDELAGRLTTIRGAEASLTPYGRATLAPRAAKLAERRAAQGIFGETAEAFEKAGGKTLLDIPEPFRGFYELPQIKAGIPFTGLEATLVGPEDYAKIAPYMPSGIRKAIGKGVKAGVEMIPGGERVTQYAGEIADDLGKKFVKDWKLPAGLKALAQERRNLTGFKKEDYGREAIQAVMKHTPEGEIAYEGLLQRPSELPAMSRKALKEAWEAAPAELTPAWALKNLKDQELLGLMADEPEFWGGLRATAVDAKGRPTAFEEFSKGILAARPDLKEPLRKWVGLARRLRTEEIARKASIRDSVRVDYIPHLGLDEKLLGKLRQGGKGALSEFNPFDQPRQFDTFRMAVAAKREGADVEWPLLTARDAIFKRINVSARVQGNEMFRAQAGTFSGEVVPKQLAKIQQAQKNLDDAMQKAAPYAKGATPLPTEIDAEIAAATEAAENAFREKREFVFSPEIQAAIDDLDKIDPRAPWAVFVHKVTTEYIKPLITTWHPAFNIRNVVGGIQQGWLDPNVGLKSWQFLWGKTGRLLKEIGTGNLKDAAKVTFSSPTGVTYTGRDLWEIARREGVFGFDIVRQEDLAREMSRFGRRKAESLLTTPPVGRSGGDFARIAEDRMRFNGFVANIEAGMSPAEAAQRTRDIFVDYSPISADETLLRDVIPFFKYPREMIPQILKAIGERPRIAAPVRAGRSLMAGQKDEEGRPPVLPPYVKETLAVPFGGDRFVHGLGSPFEAFSNLGDPTTGFAGVKETAREVGSQLTPILRTPLELATGQDLFRGEPLRERRKLPRGMERLLPAAVKALLGDEATMPDGTTATMTSPTVTFLIHGLPTQRLLKTFADDVWDERKGAVERVAKVLGFSRIDANTEQQIKQAVIRELERMAAEGDVSKYEVFSKGPGEATPEEEALLRAYRRR